MGAMRRAAFILFSSDSQRRSLVLILCTQDVVRYFRNTYSDPWSCSTLITPAEPTTPFIIKEHTLKKAKEVVRAYRTTMAHGPSVV